MAEYMLDTNICIYLIRNKSEKVLRRFENITPGEICISVITMAELEYGVCKSKYPERAGYALMQFLAGIEIVSLNAEAAEVYGQIRSDLEKQGNPIGPNDLLIAAHAKSLGITLVSNNTREFERVKGLKLENWA